MKINALKKELAKLKKTSGDKGAKGTAGLTLQRPTGGP